MSLTVQRAAARFVTTGDGWCGWSCFSYGEHYDPQNLSFGRMLACNEFVLEPGAGFGLHRHAGIDVVTTVLSGTLTHVVGDEVQTRDPGSYVFATGGGAGHDERNDGDAAVRFVQAWFVPGTADLRPQWHALAPEVGVVLRPKAFALVVAGEVRIEDEELAEGDSLRVDAQCEAVARTAAQLLVWPC